MDRMNAASRKGLFESNDEEAYSRLIQKLYAQSKAQLESNASYRQQSKEKIRKIIQDYYAPLDYKVEITFTNELRSKVVDEARQ
jgi:hypothetical protein